MPEQWFYRQDGQEYGPVTLQELKQRVDAGQIGPVVMVRKQGESNWRKAKLRRGQSPPGPSRDKVSVGSSEASAATVPLDDPPQPPASASGERQATISPTEQVVRPVEKPSTGAPQVFISSTCEDLGSYRAAAREAAIRAGFYPDMSDDWAAKDTLPLDECLAKVAGDDVLVVIVAHRFGWVPEDQPGAEADRNSITWLECEAAKAQGMRVLAFPFRRHEPIMVVCVISTEGLVFRGGACDRPFSPDAPQTWHCPRDSQWRRARANRVALPPGSRCSKGLANRQPSPVAERLAPVRRRGPTSVLLHCSNANLQHPPPERPELDSTPRIVPPPANTARPSRTKQNAPCHR